MRRVLYPDTSMLTVLLSRTEDLAARLGRGPEWELQLEVLGTGEADLTLHYSLAHLAPQGESGKTLRVITDKAMVTLAATGLDSATGQLRLYLDTRQSRQQDSMHHFEYATRADLLRLAADRITAKVQEFFAEGEFTFPHQTTWTTSDNDRTLYLRKTQGSHLIG